MLGCNEQFQSPVRFPRAQAQTTNRAQPGKRVRVHAKARKPGTFEVLDLSPPSKSLGLHSLPPETTNGDEVTIHGRSYIVKTTVIRYKLCRGRYRQDYKRLEVLGTSRYLTNMYLDNLMKVNE